jgi:hypothetical protein
MCGLIGEAISPVFGHCCLARGLHILSVKNAGLELQEIQSRVLVRKEKNLWQWYPGVAETETN